MIKRDGRLVKRFWYQMYECSRIETYLTDMAKKGWMLQKFEKSKFTFQPCNPSELRFSVHIFDDTMAGDPYKEAKNTYLELCEKAGWNFISNYQKVYIFYTKDKYAVPIETDDEITLSTINKYFLKEMSYHWFLLPLLGIFILAGQMDDFKSFISDYMSIAVFSTWMVQIVNALVGITIYCSWYFMSKKRVKNGLPLKFYDGKNRSILMIINLFLGCGVFLLLSIAGILEGDIFLVIIIAITVICILVSLYKTGVEGWGVKAKIISMISLIFIIIISFSLLTAVAVLSNQDFFTKSQVLMYMEDGGLTFEVVDHDTIPVTLEDCGITNKLATSKESDAYTSATIFAQSYSYSDNYLSKDGDYLSGIDYELFASDFQWVIDKYLDDEWIHSKYDLEFRQEDPSQFKADKLYVQIIDAKVGRYIAVYGKKVLILNLEEEPTSEQIDLFLNKLIYS